MSSLTLDLNQRGSYYHHRRQIVTFAPQITIPGPGGSQCVTSNTQQYAVVTHCGPTRAERRHCCFSWSIFHRLSFSKVDPFHSIAPHRLIFPSICSQRHQSSHVLLNADWRRSTQRQPCSASNKVSQGTQDHHSFQHWGIDERYNRPRRRIRNPTFGACPSVSETARGCRDRSETKIEGSQGSTGVFASVSRYSRLHQGKRNPYGQR